MQLAREREVGLRICAARPRACDGTCRDRAVAHAHQALGRRADDSDAIQLRHAAERPGIGLAQPSIDLMRLHAAAATSRASRGKDSPDRCRPRRCTRAHARTACRYWRGSSSATDDSTSPSRRVRQARDASQIARDSWNQLGGIGLGDDPATTAVVLVNHRRGNANRLRDRAGDRLRQPQSRLDLAGELVTKVDEPAAREWHTAGLVASTPALARAATIDRAPGGSAPTRRMPRAARQGARKQNVEAAQRLAGRGALEERGIQVR